MRINTIGKLFSLIGKTEYIIRTGFVSDHLKSIRK